MNIAGGPGPTYAGRPALPPSRANRSRGTYMNVNMYT